jgi:hypothetical protein
MTKILYITTQGVCSIFLGEFQELHSIFEHQMIRHEPFVQHRLKFLPCEGFKEVGCFLLLKHPIIPYMFLEECLNEMNLFLVYFEALSF